MFKEYQKMIDEALDTVDEVVLKTVTDHIVECAKQRKQILTIGNGGSAAIAEHWSCDHTKGVGEDTYIWPNVTNLASNMALMTAIANDMSYEQVFSKQIEYHQSDLATVVAITSSGSSPNIIKALEQAKYEEYTTIAFVGFDGGQILRRNLADHIVHVKSNNYGVVEDCHQILMHAMAQYMRKQFTVKDLKSLKL